MDRDLDFSGASVLITGAASGIGAATARWLAVRGAARLILVDLRPDLRVAEQAGCTIQQFTGDVADPALWEQLEREVPASTTQS
jgi:2-keto-3-deoxy-L-fuconate dehydrogenase